MMDKAGMDYVGACLAQISQAANAVMAVATAQNLATTLMLLNEQPICKYFNRAGVRVVTLSLAGAAAIYFALVFLLYLVERSLLPVSGGARGVSLLLMLSRLASIGVTFVPLVVVGRAFGRELPESLQKRE